MLIMMNSFEAERKKSGLLKGLVLVVNENDPEQ
jgi:hypothetical protein